MPQIFGNRMKSRVDARQAAASIPTYTLGKQRREIPWKKIVPIAIALVLILAIYLPPLFIKGDSEPLYASVNITSLADVQSLEKALTHLRNNPDIDFDGDGLINELENTYGTNAFYPDTDLDGTYDYAELYVTESNPTIYDSSLLEYVQQTDAKNNNSVLTPFKIHDIVMWADDYTARSRGGVIQLMDGSYNFYLFSGWVQFPGNVEAAYKVVNGTQTALKKNDNGYFYIDTQALTNVRVYDSTPEGCHVVSMFGNKIGTLPDNVFGKFLSAILPSNGIGIITCKPALRNDFDGTWDEQVVSNKPSTTQTYGYADTRFGKNELLVYDLSRIMKQIDNGNNVLISFVSSEIGEAHALIYGYTSKGNLLVCNPNTGEELGIVNIKILGERILNGNGTISSYEHFSFNGCGFSSAAKNRFIIIDAVPAG